MPIFDVMLSSFSCHVAWHHRTTTHCDKETIYHFQLKRNKIWAFAVNVMGIDNLLDSNQSSTLRQLCSTSSASHNTHTRSLLVERDSTWNGKNNWMFVLTGLITFSFANMVSTGTNLNFNPLGCTLRKFVVVSRL